MSGYRDIYWKPSYFRLHTWTIFENESDAVRPEVTQ